MAFCQDSTVLGTELPPITEFLGLIFNISA